TPVPTTPRLSMDCSLVTVPDGTAVGQPSYRLTLVNVSPVSAWVHSWTVDYYNRQGDIVHQDSGAFDPGAAMLVRPWHMRHITEPTGYLDGLGVIRCQGVGWDQS